MVRSVKDRQHTRSFTPGGDRACDIPLLNTADLGKAMVVRSGAGHRTVVVHEAPLMHEALRAVLHRAGMFTVVAAALGPAEGLRQLGRHRPDLAICTGAAALHFCAKVRRVSPDTRIVLLSGRSDVVLATRAL